MNPRRYALNCTQGAIKWWPYMMLSWYMVSPKSYLYRLSIDELTISQRYPFCKGIRQNKCWKTTQKQSCGNWLFLTTLLFAQYYFCIELFVCRIILIQNYSCTELFLYRSILVQIYLCTYLFLYRTIFMDIRKVNPVRTALLRWWITQLFRKELLLIHYHTRYRLLRR